MSSKTQKDIRNEIRGLPIDSFLEISFKNERENIEYLRGFLSDIEPDRIFLETDRKKTKKSCAFCNIIGYKVMEPIDVLEIINLLTRRVEALEERLEKIGNIAR